MGSASGLVDRDALLRDLMTAENYHQSTVRLAGVFARSGTPFMEAQRKLFAAMDGVPQDRRDNRWRSRRADINRVLEYIYGKEAIRLDASGIVRHGGAGDHRSPNDGPATDRVEKESPNGSPSSREPPPVLTVNAPLVSAMLVMVRRLYTGR